ncbi:MAG: CHASE2 domain-containing protein [Gammaproteobacteria bacterium]
MKKGFWRRDWFTGLLIVAFFLAIANSGVITGLERSAYDLGLRLSDRAASDRIAVIAIDDESIANLGRWPWPRDRLGRMIEQLADSGARVIGNTILLSEPQIDPGLVHINQLIEFYDSSALAYSGDPDAAAFGQQLRDSRADLDTDAKLAASMTSAGNVVMGMQFNLSRSGVVLSRPDSTLPASISRNQVDNKSGNPADGAPWPAESATPPIPALAEAAAAIGHMNTWWDADGTVRSELLLIDYDGSYYPSLALQIAARNLNLTSEDIQVQLGEAVTLGRLRILTDSISRMYPYFYQGDDNRSAFSVDSFYDVVEGKITTGKYQDKIVLLGATAFGVGTPFPTPVAEGMPPVLVLANVVSSILNQDFFVEPVWGEYGRLGAFALIALFLILLVPRLSAGWAALGSLILLLGLFGSSQYLLIQQSMWVQLMWPAALLVGGYLLLISKRFLATEIGKLKSDEASAESNRMLGLAFQQQGQLDMAFEKFRKCPQDENIAEPLYNLALDYERKRQFNKAVSVYEYINKFSPKFKDLQDRLKRSRNMQDTLIIGGSGGKANATLMLAGDGVSKPMLGRYEVEKELGKGAMGVVYLGRDPKINRVVAVKTLALSEEFEGDELEQVKSRFFREAETAGRLTHPNIVTIYDAGEEHDLAYIAMEFLSGHDMTVYTQLESLLPIRKVLEVTAMAADALDYAHGKNVVHRDIKPANIMFEPDTGAIKLTDFGIARITDSSKTKTGMVLGTPSYMSPEQLSGKKVDGRSDIFSLGVMFYQLLTGKLPFRGESMATLMFKIANDPHPILSEVRPDIAGEAPCVMAIIDKALVKDPDQRYQRGSEMAADLRSCLQTLGVQP